MSEQTSGLAGVPLSLTPLARKDFASEAEVRWCPGCGDYAILSIVQQAMAELGIARENTVIVSGIGCSSRFPYYMDTYGIHSLHGRAPTLATGIALARPDLSVWVVTGDGDGLSIGGNHLIHALRRNVNLTILLFNNRIYSLTKGQPSPTSEQGKVTKTSPAGSLDAPFDPMQLALGAGATFAARALDSDRVLLAEVLEAAARHRGAALPELPDLQRRRLRRAQGQVARAAAAAAGRAGAVRRRRARCAARSGVRTPLPRAADGPLGGDRP